MQQFSAMTPDGPDAEPTPPEGAWIEGPASLPMYVAGWIVAASGLYAVHAALDEPGFANLALVLTSIGFAISYLGRRHAVCASNLQVLAGIAAAAVLVIAVVGGPPLSLLLPMSAAGDQQKSMAVLLTWMAVVMSFILSGDAWLLLLCVLTLARIGLVSTMAVDAPLITDFVVFLLATAFMMVHENALRTPEGRAGTSPSGRSGGILAGQLLLAGVCIGGAAIGASFLSSPLHAIGGYLSLTAGIVPVTRQPRSQTTGTPIRFSESGEKLVGQGPVSESDQIVLRVRTNLATNLRGATFDLYTGRGWRSTFGAGPDLHPTDALGSRESGYFFYSGFRGDLHTFRLRPNPLTETGPGARTVQQEFRIQGGVFNDVYAAAEIRVLKLFQFRLQTDEAGGVHPVSPVQATYAAESEVPNADEKALRSAGQAYPAAIREHYLQVSAEAPAALQLAGAANRVTARERTPYDKVVALQRWVSRRCKYNLSAAAVPAGQDVAAHFLFTSMEGYCDSFATALTLLCRSVGIPARVATGFLPGELDQYTGYYLVRERDKHMWTEVYFPQIGWVPFDATEGAQDVTRPAAAAARQKGGLAAFLFGRGALPPLALLALISMLAYVVRTELLDRLRARSRGSGSDPYALPPTNAAVVDAYAAACVLLGRRGVPRRPADTPFEYLRSMQDRLVAQPSAVGALARLTTLCVDARYGGEVATPSDVDEARDALHDLRQALRSVRRRELARQTAAPQEV